MIAAVSVGAQAQTFKVPAQRAVDEAYQKVCVEKVGKPANFSCGLTGDAHRFAIIAVRFCPNDPASATKCGAEGTLWETAREAMQFFGLPIESQ